MKYFRVTYIPIGRQDKEWMVWQAANVDELKKFFNAGSLISIKEITKEEFKDAFLRTAKEKMKLD